MAAKKTQKLKAVLVGCGGMGSGQAKILKELEEFELAAVCDIDQARAEKAAGPANAKAYTDFAGMLAEEKPDTVSVCTANDTHAELTVRSAEAGVKGVYCEKPMTTNMKDARAMVDACKTAGAALVINHQRRIQSDLVEMRRLVETGAIGEVRVIRGQCAGDILSDGTHLVDSIMWLAGDAPVEWVLGQVHRDMEAAKEVAEKRKKGRSDPPGFRFGHPVETGGFGVIGFESGLRAEIACGDMREERRTYQDYELFGDRGRLWRTGDSKKSNLFIQDRDGGTWTAETDEWAYKPVPAPEGERGDWRPVEPEPLFEGNAIAESYRRFARMIHQERPGPSGEGTEHSMSGEIAIRGFEVVMAIYESARLNRKIRMPLRQDRFPLEIMIEEGRL